LGVVSEASASEAYTHDGFYLQLAAGIGHLGSSAESGGVEAKYSGITVPTSLMLGGTIGPVVIGGGFFRDYAPSPSATINGNDANLTDVTLSLIGLGFFADIYPDPKSGLHFQPFLGWGGLEATFRGNAGGSDPTGMVLALGVGYDFWVGSEWSIGPMVRVAYAPLSMNGVEYNTLAPSLLATFTYH
jgi:hypothetical protein